LKCLVGLDDTDSSTGYCTTYLGFRIAVDLQDDLRVLQYPRLVRLNPNIPFKTRGNAAVCLSIEAADPDLAFRSICSKVTELSDVKGGANSGVVFLDDSRSAEQLEGLYLDALCSVVNVHRVERLLRELGARTMTLGNGMGLVGAASSLGFDERFDHTYELISYRRKEFWGKPRAVDADSVKEMDRRSYPRTFNNYDYQKRKVLIAPHGPDPVFVGIRGDSPETVLSAFEMIRKTEEPDGHMVYLSNQHTEAHLARELDWKVFSSGWAVGTVEDVEVGQGAHLYFVLRTGNRKHHCAVYEPTGDLRRAAKLLRDGDEIKVYGGVRRATTLHPKVLNVEKICVLSLAPDGGERTLVPGTYVASPRANRHLSKPLIRHGNEVPGQPSEAAEGWLHLGSIAQTPRLARSL
jgi:tRNA(Ile2)-agmatinylcytidine synthase